MNQIIDLQEISSNVWLAKYKGHFGVYTIKVIIEKKEIKSFSCTCPSEHYPCKHYSIVKNFILNRRGENKPVEKNEMATESQTVEKLLEGISLPDLYDFLVRQAKNIPQLSRAISFEFANKACPKETINIALVLCEELKEYGIGILYSWFEKAQKRIEEKKYSEAIEICKACIEEFASWMETVDKDTLDFIGDDYQFIPFEILNRVAFYPEVDLEALFDYCKSEFTKPKYSKIYIYDYFNELLMNLAEAINPDEFIAIQDELFAKIVDKTSKEARKILQWKINFYRDTHQTEKSWKLIEKNLQIEIFRKKLTIKKIEEQRLYEAKQLIGEFIAQNSDNYDASWDNLLLEIAQAENDIPVVRKIAFKFINNSFNLHYLAIYKTTFTSEEWATELENLLLICEEKDKGFSSHAADILVTENASERLMNYIEKYLWIERLEKYYLFFASSFPEKTLELFKKGIDKYLQNNTGKNHYEYVADLMQKMLQVENGQKVVGNMVIEYMEHYKTRKSLHGVLENFL